MCGQRRFFTMFFVLCLPVFFIRPVTAAKHSAEDYLEVNWNRVVYNRMASLYNPKLSSHKPETSQNLTLACEIKVLDPNRILGISSEGIITRIEDTMGREIILDHPKVNQVTHMSYRGLRYDRRFVTPKPPARWRRWMRTVLRLPPIKPQPKWINELQPAGMQLTLPLDLTEQNAGEISRVKGYLYALQAESLKTIDVPFEPNNAWVLLTPDVEIQIEQAQRMGSSIHYKINTRDLTGKREFPSIRIGDSLPSHIVVARTFVGDEGKPVGHPNMGGRLFSHIGGGGSASGSNLDKTTKFRFVIAVNPSHQQVPFEFEHIPLPQP